jgi:outer membrane protein insertion porin family
MRCTLPLSALALALAISVHAAEPFQASDIRIDGLKRVSSGSVFDALTIQPGDRVTDADISMATRALFETGFFDQVEVRADGDVLGHRSHRASRGLSHRHRGQPGDQD